MIQIRQLRIIVFDARRGAVDHGGGISNPDFGSRILRGPLIVSLLQRHQPRPDLITGPPWAAPDGLVYDIVGVKKTRTWFRISKPHPHAGAVDQTRILRVCSVSSDARRINCRIPAVRAWSGA